MKNLNISKTGIATIILAILLLSSTFAVFAEAQMYYPEDTIASSQAAMSDRLNPATGEPYGNLTQYEWASYGADGENTRFNNGPAPNTGTLLWRSSVSLYNSGYGGSACTAFNGFVYAFTTSSVISAFNITTGERVWQCSGVSSGVGMFGTMSPQKVNNEVMLIISSSNLYYVNCSNGILLSTTPVSAIGGAYGFSSIGGGGSVSYWQVMYDPETNVLITTASESGSYRHLGVAIDCSDPVSGAKVMWKFFGGTGLEALAMGDGKAFFGGYGEGIVFCVDIQTGQELWRQYKSGNAGYSATYYDGILYHSASSTEITAFDGATGTIVASFDVSGGRAFYAYGLQAAYGRVFDKSIEIPQGWVGAWDAKTLEQQWKQPAQYYICYLVGCVADGKYFVSAADRSSGAVPGGGAFFDGYHFTAYDAFTGEKLWDVPYNFVMPNVAYGCLFGTGTVGSTRYLLCFGDVAGAGNLPQSQAWPQFHGPMGEDGTQTGVVSGNYPTVITSASWAFEADAPASGSPVVGEGKVFFGTWGGTLYAVDAFKGTELWSNKYTTRILSTPLINDGVVYTGADDGNVYALNATNGDEIWKAPAGGISEGPTRTTAWQVKSSPLYWAGMLYAAADDGNLYAFNATTGARQWIVAVSTIAYGNSNSMTLYTDKLNRTCIYIRGGGAYLRQVDINGTLINSVTSSVGTARANHGAITIVDDYLFFTYGTGNGNIAVRNATTLGSIATSAIATGLSASTPMTQTPTYVASNVCNFSGGTNLGWGTSQSQRFIVNNTDQAKKTLPAIFVAASTHAAALAFITPGTNLGNGTTNTLQWIVNSTNPYFVRLWQTWGGHQVYASASVAQLIGTNSGTNVDYIGNAAYGFTAYNCTDGAVLSTFTALAQVFASAALAYNNVYVTANDGNLYCFFGGSQGTTSIYADSNKGSSMLADEPTEIKGRLEGYQFFQSEVDPNNNETFAPSLPYQQITFVWINEDGTSVETSTTTDLQGYFNFTYTPTKAGTATWLCYFPGATLGTGVSLSQAYTTYQTMTVIGGEITPPPTEEPTQPPGELLPIVYIYVIVGIIVALVVILAVVMVLRKRKK